MAHGIFNLIKKMSDNREQITIPKLFVSMTGDLVTAAVLKQIIFWSDKKDDGWFYKTAHQWNDEIGISQFQIRSAINGDKRYKNKRLTLKDIGVEVKRSKMPNGGVTNFYRINENLFTNVVIHYLKHLKMPSDSELSAYSDNELSRQSDYALSSQSDSELSAESFIQKETYTESNTNIKKQTKKNAATAAGVLSDSLATGSEIDKPTHPTLEENKIIRAAAQKVITDKQLDAWSPRPDSTVSDLRQAIASVWPGRYPLGGNVNNSVRMEELLCGRATLRSWKPYNLEPATDAVELLEWHSWWRRKQDADVQIDAKWGCWRPADVQVSIQVFRNLKDRPAALRHSQPEHELNSLNSLIAEG